MTIILDYLFLSSFTFGLIIAFFIGFKIVKLI